MQPTKAPISPRAAGARMRAGVLTGPREATVVDAEIPSPGPSEVRLRVEGCGVCGSNLPLWQGREWFEYPRAAGDPGHEGWGVVDKIGADVRRVQPGDRVAALSYRSFAEFDVAPEDAVVRLPESLRGRPFPGEPLGCAMNVFRRADVKAGHTIAVIGIGFLGALLTQLASAAGACVIAVSRRGFSLDTAAACGASHTIEIGSDVTEQVASITNGALCDRVIEAVGLQEPLDLAGQLTRVRGKLIVAGFHQDGPRSVDMQLWNWRGLDVINAHERDSAVYVHGMRDAIAAIERGDLDPFPLFTHSFPLDALDQALRLLEDRPAGFMKAIVTTET